MKMLLIIYGDNLDPNIWFDIHINNNYYTTNGLGIFERAKLL